GTNKPGAQPAKHSAADPLTTALALLEHALAGVLAGAASAAPAPPNASAAVGKSAPQGGRSVAANAAAALDLQLVQTLGADAKAVASTPATAAGPSPAKAPAAAPAATPGAAAAALTAAQLTAGPQVGLQQPRPDPAPMALSSPVGSSAWTEELGAKVTWMAHQGIESASLQLSPAHLGPLQVSISVHNGQASVWFGAAQPDTRTALQQSLPQLRQLFANQGLTLADAGVSRESPRGRSRQSPGRSAAPVSAVAAVTLDGSPGRATAAGGLGLLDTYA
ncbi:MAG: flagellar hook-length control protein FliK, partial [Steroidobacteraceae bacterium]